MNDNNILTVNYVIQPDKSSYQLSYIFEKFKSSGYKFIQDYLLSWKIVLYNKTYYIYSISLKNDDNKNKSNSNKLSQSQRPFSQSSSISKLEEDKNPKKIDTKKSYNSSVQNPVKSQVENSYTSINKKPKQNIALEEEIKISEKLKSLILLSINQKKNYTISAIDYNVDKKGYKVYLMNNNLEKFKFSEINSLIKEGGAKLDTIISELNKKEVFQTSTQIKDLISKLKKEKIKQLDEEITKIADYKTFQWESKAENIKLLNSGNIKIYSEFIIASEHTYNQIKKNFNISQNLKQVYYQHISTGDIISFDKNILYGKIDKNKNIFDIKYIFIFNSESSVNTEITTIKTNIENYIKNSTVFISNNPNDLISPIFSGNNIIGTVYKYSPDNDYSKNVDYTKYIKNPSLSRFITLYNFYNKSFTTSSEKFYLVKSSIISEIKNKCDYDNLKQIFEDNNIKLDNSYGTDDKKILNLIKKIPSDILKNNFSSNANITHKYNKNETEPDMITIYNPNDKKEYAMIYNNFGIINKKIAELFIEGVNISYSSNDNNYLDCTVNDGKILINYEKKIGNENYVSIIGSIDPNDFVIYNEYALIYKKFNEYSSHNNSIKYKINKFTNELQLFNGVQPFINNKYEEYLNVIQIQQNQNPSPVPIPKPEQGPKPRPKPPIIPKDDNDEYNLNPKIVYNSLSILGNFSYRPLIGLENIGATCYMNATLQCFCNITKFVDYFKYNKHLIDIVRNDIYKQKLCSSFKLLMEKLWPDNYNNISKTYYAPHDFKTKISTMNSLFEGVQANDSKDLVNFIIMTLHEELNKAKNDKIISSGFQDQRNQMQMFNSFIQSFGATNQSIISDLFYAVNCSMTQCLSCNSITYNYQTYFFLVFPLEEVRKFKFSNMNQFNNFNNMFSNNEVNIYDCFNYDKKITYMTGNNAMYCNFCRNTSNSSMCTVLTTGPEILIIILNRGQGIQFKVKINFVEYLNLSNYIQFPNTGFNYELIGVITHLGEHGMGGHFIAYCKSHFTKTWFQYNDASVNPVKNFQNDVINYAMPYLLFYQKVQ